MLCNVKRIILKDYYFTSKIMYTEYNYFFFRYVLQIYDMILQPKRILKKTNFFVANCLFDVNRKILLPNVYLFYYTFYKKLLYYFLNIFVSCNNAKNLKNPEKNMATLWAWHY